MPRVPLWVWVLLLAGALLRVAVIELRPAGALENAPEESQYLDIAHSLEHGQGFKLNGRPTAYGDMLFPLAASVVMRLFGVSPLPVLLLQVILSCATALLFYLIALRRFGAAPAILLCGVWLFYPGAVLATALFLNATLFMFLWVASLALYDRLVDNGFRARDALLLGAAAGLTVLTRAVGVVLVAALVLYLATVRYGALHPTHWRSALIALAAALMIITPWMARNAVTVGKFALNTYMGFGLLSGDVALDTKFLPLEARENASGLHPASATDTLPAKRDLSIAELWMRKTARVWATDVGLWIHYYLPVKNAKTGEIRELPVVPVAAASLPGMLALSLGIGGFILVRRFPSRSLFLLHLALSGIALIITYGLPRDYFLFLPALLMGIAALWRPAVWLAAASWRRVALVCVLTALSSLWLIESFALAGG